jgi:hypothetical protein
MSDRDDDGWDDAEEADTDLDDDVLSDEDDDGWDDDDDDA